MYWLVKANDSCINDHSYVAQLRESMEATNRRVAGSNPSDGKKLSSMKICSIFLLTVLSLKLKCVFSTETKTIVSRLVH